jgi:hypothetical protein
MRILLSFLFALALTRAASAELVNENLLVALPPGYKIDFSDRKPKMLINEMVPADQAVKDWTEMVTVQIFYDLKTTPDAFEAKMAKGWSESCPGATSTAIAQDVENGYPAGVWMLNCPKNPATGKPEITWIKAVQGNDSFYAVQKAFKFGPSKDQIVTWMKYLRGIAVCDSRLPDRPCPKTGD